ncbi:MAG: hypothetical protein ABSE42_06660 [Bryobacteraceae bacterium]|jgi:hypothetical protein
MMRLRVAAAALALATFFLFPGHTWLQQDSQIWTPMLEHLRDPAVLRNDILAQHPHVGYTLYDEVALALRSFTGLGFGAVLALQQIGFRAVGIWGLILMATAAGLELGPAVLVAALCSLGAAIAGPAVLTVEYEPTPRAFALPLVLLAIGLTAHRRYFAAGIAAACAFLYHPPTTLGFLAIFAVLTFRRRQWWAWLPLALAAALLALAAAHQDGAAQQPFWGRIGAPQEQLQRLRASYIWLSAWPLRYIVHHLILAAALAAAWFRIRRRIPAELRAFVLGLPLLGLASMPLSWLLLERARWVLMPQLQPMRLLLFLALMMQFLAAVAAAHAALARRWLASAAWFAVACWLALQPVVTEPYQWRRVAVLLLVAVAAAAAVRFRVAPLAGAAALLLIPFAGGVVNYPRLDTPELRQLSDWAAHCTARNAVFLFPDAGRSLAPGVFRSEALRAVYVDWKGGGQVNFVRQFGEQWWLRWSETMAPGFHPADMPKYGAAGIDYIVLQPQHRLPDPPLFANAGYLVYPVAPNTSIICPNSSWQMASINSAAPRRPFTSR